LLLLLGAQLVDEGLQELDFLSLDVDLLLVAAYSGLLFGLQELRASQFALQLCEFALQREELFVLRAGNDDFVILF
jgi:hypothetical protein